MAKRKNRVYRDKTEVVIEDKIITLSSGVKVKVSPFPSGLYNRILAKSRELYPEPEVPMKTYETVDGEETSEDYENEEYKEKLKEIETLRNSHVAEAIIDLCVEIVDLEKYDSKIKKAEKYAGVFLPEDRDSDDFKMEFLTSIGLVNAADYETVTFSAMQQAMMGSEEVEEKLEFFRNQVEESADKQG